MADYEQERIQFRAICKQKDESIGTYYSADYLIDSTDELIKERKGFKKKLEARALTVIGISDIVKKESDDRCYYGYPIV